VGFFVSGKYFMGKAFEAAEGNTVEAFDKKLVRIQ
jgi:hypothetical protein